MKRTRPRFRAPLIAGLLSVALLAGGCAGTEPSAQAPAAHLRVGAVNLDVSNIDPARGWHFR